MASSSNAFFVFGGCYLVLMAPTGSPTKPNPSSPPITSNPFFISGLAVVGILFITGTIGIIIWCRRRQAKPQTAIASAGSTDGTRTPSTNRSAEKTRSGKPAVEDQKPSVSAPSLEDVKKTDAKATPTSTPTTKEGETKKQQTVQHTPSKIGTPNKEFKFIEETESTPLTNPMHPSLQTYISNFFHTTSPLWNAPQFYEIFKTTIQPIKCVAEDRFPVPDELAGQNNFNCNAKTRLRLQKADDGFILHANVTGKRKNLILTQHPFAHSFIDFYRAVMDRGISVIIMLVNRESISGPLYYPSEHDPKTGKMELYVKKNGRQLRVRTTFQNTIGAINSTRLTAQIRNEYTSFDIQHYYVPNWHDLSTFNSYSKNLDLFDDIVTMLTEAIIVTASAPLLIHCLEGTGATGSVALAIELVQLVLDGEKNIDPVAVGKAIRCDRDGAIQTPLEFCIGILLALKVLSGRLNNVTPSIAEIVNKFEKETKQLHDNELQQQQQNQLMNNQRKMHAMISLATVENPTVDLTEKSFLSSVLQE